jgi:hypothetical protein
MAAANSGSVGRGKPFVANARGSREKSARPVAPLPRLLNRNRTLWEPRG